MIRILNIILLCFSTSLLFSGTDGTIRGQVMDVNGEPLPGVQILIADWLSTHIFHQTSLLTQVITIHALSLPIYILIHISSFSTQAYKLLKHKIFVGEIQNPLILLLCMVIFYVLFSMEFAIMFPVVISSLFGLITISVSLNKVAGVRIISLISSKFNRDLLYYSLPIMFMSILLIE